MLMLPPIAKTDAPERRVGQRRRAERRAAAQAVNPAAEAFRPNAEAEPTVEPAGRKGRGRRAADRAAPDGPGAFVRAPKSFAPLVAQLIATALGVEQTRIRRRGANEEATALYRRPRERPKRSRGDA